MSSVVLRSLNYYRAWKTRGNGTGLMNTFQHNTILKLLKKPWDKLQGSILSWDERESLSAALWIAVSPKLPLNQEYFLYIRIVILSALPDSVLCLLTALILNTKPLSDAGSIDSIEFKQEIRLLFLHYLHYHLCISALTCPLMPRMAGGSVYSISNLKPWATHNWILFPSIFFCFSFCHRRQIFPA